MGDHTLTLWVTACPAHTHTHTHTHSLRSQPIFTKPHQQSCSIGGGVYVIRCVCVSRLVAHSMENAHDHTLSLTHNTHTHSQCCRLDFSELTNFGLSQLLLAWAEKLLRNYLHTGYDLHDIGVNVMSNCVCVCVCVFMVNHPNMRQWRWSGQSGQPHTQTWSHCGRHSYIPPMYNTPFISHTHA